MLRWVSGLWLLLLAVPVAVAEERFYPIVGPDGRMQMIRSEAPAAAKPGASPEAVAPASGEDATRGAKATDPGKAEVPPAATVGGEAANLPASPAAPHAAYDSDEYTDSEAVEAAARPAGDKRRFYLIDDGLGPRVSESGGGPGGELMPPEAAPAAVEQDESQPLAVKRRTWTPGEAARDLPWLPACTESTLLKQARPLLGGEPAEQVVAAADYAFMPSSRILGSYRLDGEGPRTLLLRSYSRKSRQPAFLHPQLALLDKEGCLTRVVHAYFVRLYPATDRRHAYLRADLVVHTGEEWLLLLAPAENDKAAAALPWRESGFGQLKFTLKK